MGDMEDVAYAIEAHGLVKRFGKTTALAGVDLAARTGSVLGLLGPNGAGKTTAVRILATLLRPEGGSATVCGYDAVRDAHQVRQLIGLTGQYASVDEGLSGTNNLIMIGRLLGLSRPSARARAAELLMRFELTDAAGRAAKTYSGGMRRRLDLAASLVGRPRVLYLDEPTTGLDPRSRNEVWGMVRQLVADGTTALLTTQYPEDLFGLWLQPIMVLFTYVFGGAIEGGTHKYLQFSLPGILVLSVVFATLGTGMMLSQDISTGVFDRFRALPIVRWAPLAGAILGDLIPAATAVERSLLWAAGIFAVFAPLAVAAYRPARDRRGRVSAVRPRAGSVCAD
jgi:ABC-type Na+ transport system ATPase subunit NatA